VDHPPRRDSAGYRASPKLMAALADTLADWTYAPRPYQDHHGGTAWSKTETAGCARARASASSGQPSSTPTPPKPTGCASTPARLIAAFPLTFPGYADAGHTNGERLLSTPVTAAEQVGDWTDHDRI
jgi:hypothetical protein